MQDKIINFILGVNQKFFFKREHPFNIEKGGILNLNYSDFEYKHTERLLGMYGEIIDSNIFKNKKILDIGCGAGGKAVYIAKKYNSEVFGIDINDNFLKQAKDFAIENKVDKFVYFEKKSALNTGFNIDKFDVIIMSDVIEHIPETEKLFEEVWRILKPGGILLFDFAPYYHYFGHHIWDTIQIPWIHLLFSDKFLIRLYKKSVEGLIDGKERIKLRIGHKKGKEIFDYINKIKRKNFEKIMRRFVGNHNIEVKKINYYMLKNLNFLGKIPFVREVFIKHIVGYLKK